MVEYPYMLIGIIAVFVVFGVVVAYVDKIAGHRPEDGHPAE